MLGDSSTHKPNSGAVLLAVLFTLVFQPLPPTCSSSERRWDRTKQQNYKAMNEFFLRNDKMPLDRISGGNGTSKNDTTDNSKPDGETGVTNPAKNTKSIALTIVAIVAASLLVVVLAIGTFFLVRWYLKKKRALKAAKLKEDMEKQEAELKAAAKDNDADEVADAAAGEMTTAMGANKPPEAAETTTARGVKNSSREGKSSNAAEPGDEEKKATASTETAVPGQSDDCSRFGGITCIQPIEESELQSTAAPEMQSVNEVGPYD